MSWTAEQLSRIAAARELTIAVRGEDGTLGTATPIWVVSAADEVFVRSWYRRDTGWFGQAVRTGRAQISVPGVQADVVVDDLGADPPELRATIDGAYADKYGASAAADMMGADAAATTLRLRVVDPVPSSARRAGGDGDAEPDPRTRIRPPEWLKDVNAAVLADPQQAGILTVAGRRSGLPRRTPLTIHETGGVRYVVGGFPGADWVRNLRAGGDAELTLNGRTERVSMVEVDDATAEQVLRAWPTVSPDGVTIMRDAGVVTDTTADALAEVTGICPVFRVETR